MMEEKGGRSMEGGANREMGAEWRKEGNPEKKESKES